MRMIWQAIRAVTVEVMGVGAVIFILFGAAGWTVDSIDVKPEQQVDRAWQWLQETTGQVTATIKPNMTAAEREHFAAERLDYYGRLYGEAAGNYAAQPHSSWTLSPPPPTRSLPFPRTDCWELCNAIKVAITLRVMSVTRWT